MERAGLNISALACTSALSRKLILSLSLLSSKLKKQTVSTASFNCDWWRFWLRLQLCGCFSTLLCCCCWAADSAADRRHSFTFLPSFRPRQRSSLSNGDGEARFLQKLLGKTTFVRLNNPFGPLHIFTTELLYFYCDTCHVQSLRKKKTCWKHILENMLYLNGILHIKVSYFG